MPRKVQNIAGYIVGGKFRPIRDDDDYDPGRLSPESLLRESKKVQREEGLTTVKRRSKAKGRKKNPAITNRVQSAINQTLHQIKGKLGGITHADVKVLNNRNVVVTAHGRTKDQRFRVIDPLSKKR